MKIIIAFILFFIIRLVSNAQSLPEQSYAVINDPDGFVNVRKEKNAKAAIEGKIYKDDIFTCLPDKSDWWQVLHIEDNLGIKGNWLEGYVHKSRITLLLHWKTINKKNVFKDSSFFKNDSLIVIIKKAKFNPAKHKLFPKSGFISSIDGKPFYGTDGPIPKQVISSVKIVVNGQPVIIPQNAFGDLYEPNLQNLSISFGPEKTIYVLMENSDGAGGYYIIWIIKNNKYYKRYVDNSDA